MNVQWNLGFVAGAKEQRKRDLEAFAEVINSLDVKGVGDKRKAEIIQAINKKVGK